VERELDREPGIARELDYLMEAAVCRELYRQKVGEATVISDEQCREAYLRDQTDLWVQHTAFDMNKPMDAPFTDMKWEHVPIHPGLKQIRENGVVVADVVSWNQVDRELEDLLYSLPLNKVSTPVQMGDKRHCFRVINRETTQMESEAAYNLEMDRYLAATRKRMEHERAFALVRETMQPQELTFKGPVVEELVNILWEVRQEGLPENQEGEGAGLPRLEALGDEVLAVFGGREYTVADFRFHYKMNPLELDDESRPALQKSLFNAVGIYVRDRVFAELGRAAGYDELDRVRDDFQYWRERLLAQRLTARIQEPDDSTESIAELLQDLRKQARIRVDEKRLLAVETSDVGLTRPIDFFAKTLN